MAQKGLHMMPRTTNLFSEARSLLFDAASTVNLTAGTYTVSINAGTGKLTLSGAAAGEVLAGGALTFTVAVTGDVTFTPSEGTPARNQLERYSYKTPWHKVNTRAAQKLSVITPSIPPSDFGIGATVKMDLASTQTGLPSMTFVRQGPYHVWLDAADKKMKCTNGVVTVATPALTWAVNGVIDGYGGRIDGKLFVRARVNAGAAQYAEAVADHVDSGTLFYGGERNIGLDFDEVDDLLTVTDYAAIQNIFNGGGTVEMWIKPTVVSATTRVICGKNTNTRINTYSSILYIEQMFSTARGQWHTGAGAVIAGVPMHIMVAYDCSSVNNDPTLYLNGVPVAVTEAMTPIGTYTTDAGTNLFIGRHITAINYWAGSIWDVRYWNTKKANADDRFLRLVGNEANLAAAWPMDECTGATSLNIVAGGNNAAITGSVWAAEQVMHGKVYDVRRDDRRKDVAAKLGVS